MKKLSQLMQIMRTNKAPFVGNACPEESYQRTDPFSTATRILASTSSFCFQGSLQLSKFFQHFLSFLPNHP